MIARLLVITFRALATITSGATFRVAFFRQFGPVAIIWLWAQSVGRVIQILHEQHFVALLVVNQVIQKFGGHQDAKSARTLALRLTRLHVLEGIILWIGDRAVLQLFQRKPLAGIFHPA